MLSAAALRSPAVKRQQRQVVLVEQGQAKRQITGAGEILQPHRLLDADKGFELITAVQGDEDIIITVVVPITGGNPILCALPFGKARVTEFDNLAHQAFRCGIVAVLHAAHAEIRQAQALTANVKHPVKIVSVGKIIFPIAEKIGQRVDRRMKARTFTGAIAVGDKRAVARLGQFGAGLPSSMSSPLKLPVNRFSAMYFS